MGALYVFGHSAAEMQRLERQSSLLDPLSRSFLCTVLTPGMCVLDLGCGAGDFTFLAADLVGSSGRVVGVDKSERAICSAVRRAVNHQRANVLFVQADVQHLPFGCEFDAVIGRFVMSYTGAPSTVLMESRRALRTGGVIACQEWDLTRLPPAYPASPAFDALNRRIVDILSSTGVQLDMGLSLPGLLDAEGMVPVSAGLYTYITGSNDSEMLVYLYDTAVVLDAAAEAWSVLAQREPLASLWSRMLEEFAEGKHTITLAPIASVAARARIGDQVSNAQGA